MIPTFENKVPFSDGNGSGRQKAVFITNISFTGIFLMQLVFTVFLLKIFFLFWFYAFIIARLMTVVVSFAKEYSQFHQSSLFLKDFHLFKIFCTQEPMSKMWMVVNQHWFLATLECDFPPTRPRWFHLGGPLVGNEGKETKKHNHVTVSFPHSLLRATQSFSFVWVTPLSWKKHNQRYPPTGSFKNLATWRWIMNHFWFWMIFCYKLRYVLIWWNFCFDFAIAL